MKLYKFIINKPSRIAFLLASAVIVSSAIFYFQSKEAIIETISELGEDIQYGNLAVQKGIDFGGGLIQFYEPEGITQLTFDNDLLYDREKGRLQISKEIVNKFTLITEYNSEKQYVFSYDGEKQPQKQQYLLTDNIQSVVIGGDLNEIILNMETYSAFDISEDENFFYIQPIPPKMKYSKIVMLDPGHGGNDEGASTGEYDEKDINISIAQKALDLFNQNLDETGIKAYMTRYGDETVHKTERPPMSNEIADMFISIHCNTYPDTAVSGTQTLFDSDGKTDLSRLNITNNNLALIMQSKVVEALSTKDRSINIDHELVVLNRARIPAVLIETAFMTNKNDLEKLISEYYHQRIAQAIFDGVVEAFNYTE